jgi:dephospho-CoA kinase
MLIVGLTGGIVSGKTTIAKMFQELGAQVIDADEIARKVVSPGEKACHGIVEYFGPEVLRDDLEINRKKLADIVFSNKEKLAVLNSITHPEIILMLKKQINQLKNKYQKNIICIVEAPLLFEAHLEDMMDKIIVVYLNREEQLKRLLLRNNLTREEAIQRIESQMPLEEKLSRADYVIDNCFSLQQTKKKVLQVWKELEKNLSAKS